MKIHRLLPALSIAIAITLLPFSARAEEAAAAPQVYGAPVTVKKSLSLAKLEKKPERFVGKTVKIEGTVREVCQGRGCWIEVEGKDGSTFLAKSLDESVLVPKDCQGWQVIVQGVVTQLAAKGHEGHDHAHDEAEAGHSCPAPKFVVATQGVALKRAAAAKN